MSKLMFNRELPHQPISQSVSWNESQNVTLSSTRPLTSHASQPLLRLPQQPQQQQQQPRRTFLRKQQEEHTLGLILIGMSALFIFCQSLKMIPDLYELIVCNEIGSLGHNCAITKVPVINIITRMSHLLVCFNSSANFLIYYLNGEKFRRAWVETYGEKCCCCVCKTVTSTPAATVAMQSVRTDNNCTINQSPDRPGELLLTVDSVTLSFWLNELTCSSL